MHGDAGAVTLQMLCCYSPGPQEPGPGKFFNPQPPDLSSIHNCCPDNQRLLDLTLESSIQLVIT